MDLEFWIIGSFGQTEEETKGRKYQFVDTVGKMGERGLDSTEIYTIEEKLRMRVCQLQIYVRTLSEKIWNCIRNLSDFINVSENCK